MIRILIVDNSRLHREGLSYLLARATGLDVVDTVGCGDRHLSRIHDLAPDIVLVHVDSSDTLSMLRAIADVASGTKVVALGVAEHEEDILACAEAGVAGFLPREGTLEDLVAIIRSVACGETLCSPRIAAALFRRVATLASERQSWISRVHLTPRERDVLQLIDAGLSNKDISRHLSVDVRTVKTHVHNILEKLQVHRRGEAAAWMRHARTKKQEVTAISAMGDQPSFLRRDGV